MYLIIVITFVHSFSYVLFVWLRLPMIHLENKSMHLSSTLRTFCVHQLHCFSTPFMILLEKVLILFVDTLLVFVKVSQQLFLMDFGSTFQIMMLLLSLSSLLRGTLGMYYVTCTIYSTTDVFFTVLNSGHGNNFNCVIIFNIVEDHSHI